MSPVEPSEILPGVWEKVSQMLGPRPSSVTAPSIWYAAVAVPQTQSDGKPSMSLLLRSSNAHGSSARHRARPLPLLAFEPAQGSAVPGIEVWLRLNVVNRFRPYLAPPVKPLHDMRSERLRNLICAVLPSLALAAVLTSCISADPNSTVAPPAQPETSAPTTGEPDIPPDDPGNGNGRPKPSVPLPRLPVGGTGEFVDQETQNLQCANVNWIVEDGGPAELQSGIRIVITGFRLDEYSFRIAR